MKREAPIIRFWKHVRRAAPEECWEWQGAIGRNGYAYLSINGISSLAHRFIYQETVDPSLQGDEVIRHLCNNRRCVNPSHLAKGTQADNVRDIFTDGQGYLRRGENHWCAKLSMLDVEAIRDQHATGRISQAELARRYQVDPSTIKLIVHHRTWTNPQFGNASMVIALEARIAELTRLLRLALPYIENMEDLRAEIAASIADDRPGASISDLPTRPQCLVD